MLVAPKAFDGHFVAQAGHHNLTILGFLGGLHGQQVAIHDAGVTHGHAAHLEQIVGLALEEAVLHVIGLVDMLLRENRGAGCDPPNQRQGELGQTWQRQGILLVTGFIDGAQGVTLEADTARSATDQLDHAFACQRLQVLFGCIG